MPVQIIQACRDKRRDFFVIAFKDQADAAAFDGVPHVWVRLGAVAESLEHLRTAGCKELVLAGTVHRPSFSALRPDTWTARFFAKSGADILGDDGLLTAILKTLEENEGFHVVGPDQLIPDLLATEGVYGSIEPDPQAKEDIECGIEAARDVGSHDIAQGAVAQLGQILAVEDEKGTDALLKRVQKLRLDGPGGVLVKVKKPGQEHRVDLPAIGVTTVETASRAGLRGIAVEAGGALVFDREAMIEAANKARLFVVGIDVNGRQPKKKTPEDGLESDPSPLIFIVAGEPSGDSLGARLMASLKKECKDRVSFAGIGGAEMEEQGLKSLFPMADLSLMGVAEVLPRLPRILQRIGETTNAVERLRPAVLITIDSPDFSFRVAKRLKGKGIPLIHYVAPSVWAWRPGRARKIAGFLDHLLTLLPYEPPYFETEGLSTTFVGHPVVESGADAGDGRKFRQRHGISADEKVIVVLPGSRMSEISHLHRVFGETLFLMNKKYPGLRVLVPTVGAVASMVRRVTGLWPAPTLVLEGERGKFDAFAAADVALAASGTVALELAMAGTPTVIAYRINPFTYFFASRLIKIRYAHLLNLILDLEAVPEFLQDACRPDFLAAALIDLLADERRREKQIAATAKGLKQLGISGPSPASRAAKAVLEIIAKAGNGD